MHVSATNGQIHVMSYTASDVSAHTSRSVVTIVVVSHLGSVLCCRIMVHGARCSVCIKDSSLLLMARILQLHAIESSESLGLLGQFSHPVERFIIRTLHAL